MRTVVQGLAYMAILGAVVLIPHAIAYAIVPDTTQGAITNSIPACITEDSANCYWDAATMGNGQGNSFLDINGTAHYGH